MYHVIGNTVVEHDEEQEEIKDLESDALSDSNKEYNLKDSLNTSESLLSYRKGDWTRFSRFPSVLKVYLLVHRCHQQILFFYKMNKIPNNNF